MSVFGYIRIMPSLDDVTKDIVEDYKKSLEKAAPEQDEKMQEHVKQSVGNNKDNEINEGK